MKTWMVYLGGKKIDEVSCADNDTAEEVRDSLINHDGYPASITVAPWSPARSRAQLYHLRRK